MESNNSFCAAFHPVHTVLLVVEICRLVAVGMSDGKCRFEKFLTSRGCIRLMSTLADTAVRTGIHCPVEQLCIVCIGKFLTEIHLIESSLGINLEEEIRLRCGYSDGLCLWSNRGHKCHDCRQK